MRARGGATHERAQLLLGAVLLPLGVLAVLAAAVTSHTQIPWDAAILRYGESHYVTAVVQPLDIALRISVGLGAAFAAGAATVRLARRDIRRAMFWALSVGGVLALDIPLKDLFGRPPLGGHQGGYSFPSGNGMLAMAVFAAIVLSAPSGRRRIPVIAGTPLLLAYGIALVYAWWHYPSDVIAGWCVGLAWVTAWLLALAPPVRASCWCGESAATGPAHGRPATEHRLPSG